MEATRNVSTITAEAALELIRAARTEATSKGLKISINVVDPAMGLIAFVKGDGATPHSAETSRRKANTAASTGKATGWMGPDLAIGLPMGTGLLLTNIPGGVPIRVKGVLVGGLGIAGGTSDDDAAVAKAALGAIGADEPK